MRSTQSTTNINKTGKPHVRAEDIEDVSERYVPMFTEERNSDTVKRVKISKNNMLYFISLIEQIQNALK